MVKQNTGPNALAADELKCEVEAVRRRLPDGTIETRVGLRLYARAHLARTIRAFVSPGRWVAGLKVKVWPSVGVEVAVKACDTDDRETQQENMPTSDMTPGFRPPPSALSAFTLPAQRRLSSVRPRTPPA
jgi:hypothetical protein